MTPFQLTSAQRDRLRAHDAALERVVRDEWRFFEKNPDRRHCVRRTRAAEIKQLAIMHGYTPTRPVYTVVKSIGPGARVRAFFAGRLALGRKNEAVARWLFEECAGVAREGAA